MRATAALVLIAGELALMPAPQAQAVSCLHRGRQHVVQHANGNVDADSRWHVLRGEQPTCDPGGGTASTEDTWERLQEDIDRERHGW